MMNYANRLSMMKAPAIGLTIALACVLRCMLAQSEQLVSGGVMDKSALGLNCWATRRWKVGFDYGLTGLDRVGVHGVTNAFHTRFQWIY